MDLDQEIAFDMVEEKIDRLERKNAALKGVIKKLKSKINDLIVSCEDAYNEGYSDCRYDYHDESTLPPHRVDELLKSMKEKKNKEG